MTTPRTKAVLMRLSNHSGPDPDGVTTIDEKGNVLTPVIEEPTELMVCSLDDVPDRFKQPLGDEFFASIEEMITDENWPATEARIHAEHEARNRVAET